MNDFKPQAMKNILILALLIFSITSIAQTDELYNIIRVNGKIFNISAGEDLSQGNTLKPKDKLNFEGDYSTGIVISNLRKKYTLRMPYDLGVEDDVFAVAEMSLNPILSRGQLSTRGLMGPNGVKDLKTYLSEDNFNIIGDEIDIHLDKNLYPLNDDKFIVFYYKINDKQVSKKVGFDKQYLNINKEKLSKSEEFSSLSDTLQTVAIYQFEKSTNETNLITTTNISFINTDELRKEFLAIIPILKKQNYEKEEIRQYLFEYFFDVYGNVDETQLNNFLLQIVNSQE
jgi:hypothetical protein